MKANIDGALQLGASVGQKAHVQTRIQKNCAYHNLTDSEQRDLESSAAERRWLADDDKRNRLRDHQNVLDQLLAKFQKAKSKDKPSHLKALSLSDDQLMQMVFEVCSPSLEHGDSSVAELDKVELCHTGKMDTGVLRLLVETWNSMEHDPVQAIP